MIEKLEIKKLQKYQFDAEAIERLTTWDEYDMFLLNDSGIFWASVSEKVIYSGLEAQRKYYFRENQIAFPQWNLDLVPEYYALQEEKYISAQKKIAASLFILEDAQDDFKRLEITSTMQLIDDLKAHKMYDRLKSKQEYVEKLNWYLKWLNNLKPNNNHDVGIEDINWMEIFADVDIEITTKPKVYKTTNIEQKKNYFSQASFNLTIQFLREFKKNTYFLSNNAKLKYISGMGIKEPKMGDSESKLFNQTVYEAKCNYFDFLQKHKTNLENKVIPENAAINQANKIALLHTRLSGVAYFSPLEESNIKIPMFTNCTNDEFRAIVVEELNAISTAEKAGNKDIPDPFRSRDIMHLEKVYETTEHNLYTLFNDKFEIAKASGFITPQRFASHELKELELRYNVAAQWFPLFDQWKDFLKQISVKTIVPPQINVNEKTYTSHVYDVNLVEGLKKLEKLLPTVEFKPGALNKEEYSSRIREGFTYFCEFNGYDYQLHFKNSIALIIASDHHSYPAHLGFMLISIEVHLINAFLDHQMKKYNGSEDLLNVVEFISTPYVQSNSPFDNNMRLEKIMAWVEKKRELNKQSITPNSLIQDSSRPITELVASEFKTLANLRGAIESNDLNHFFKILQSIFSTMSYQMKLTEAFFHGQIHFMLKILDFQILSELETNDGRIDSVIETSNFIHIIEYKLQDKSIALQQILDKKYYMPFFNSPKQIILVGVSLDAKKKNIVDWEFQKYDR